MMHDHEQHNAAKGTVFSYAVGFLLSILLTLAAFGLVLLQVQSDALFSDSVLYGALLSSAIIQLFVQLFFFLHVGKESGPRWNLAALLFALIVVLILVGGTLWIMFNLQHGTMVGPFENGIVTPQTER
jgi:cytochrome o ubiquinol oxidase subunit IV